MRSLFADPSDDGLHAAALFVGISIGLIALTLYAGTLSFEPVIAPILQDLLPWQFPGVHPEPWEGYLYHIGVLGVFLGSLLGWYAMQRFVIPSFRTRNSVEYVLWIVAVLLFGSWLMLLENLHPQPQADWLSLLPTSLITWGIGFAIAALFFVRHRFPRVRLPRKAAIILEWVTVSGFIIWLAYDPISLLPVQPKSAGDAEWFLAPVHDVLSGKHLLIDSQSQYGYLLFYLLALPFSLVRLTVQHFNVILMVMHALYYGMLYVLVRSLFQNRWHAVIAFVFLLGFSYFSNEARSELYGQPSISRLRNFWDMPILLCLARELITGKKFWFRLAAILTAVAALYNVDIGVSLLLMALVYAVAVPILLPLTHLTNPVGAKYFAPTGKPNGNLLTRGEIIMAIMNRLLWVIPSVIALILLFSTFIFLKAGSVPAWPRFFEYVKLYSAGYGALPIPVVGAYWWVLASYAIAIFTVFVHWLGGRKWNLAPFVLALSVYGLVTFHYYLGRSFIGNLWTVTLPATLCAALVCKRFLERLATELPYDSLTRWWVKIPVLIASALFLASAISTSVTVAAKMMRDRYLEPIRHDIDPGYQAAFDQSVRAIQSRVPEGGRVLVISQQDALFTLASNRASALPAPLLYTIFTKQELSSALLTFLKRNHRFLFIDPKPDNCHVCDVITPFLKQYYDQTGSVGLLDIYERNTVPAPESISF